MIVKKRNYGIDLLRLLLMYMICILHVLLQGGVLGNSSNESNMFYWFIEIIFLCAVNGYALISGYVSKNRHYNYSQIVTMWLQVVFYTLIISIVLKILGIGSFGIYNTILSVLPVLSSRYWYFTAYFPLFFIMPYLNNALNNLSRANKFKLSFVLVFIFSILSIISDNYLEYGYSFLWITILYILGYFLYDNNPFEKVKTRVLIIVYFVSSLISWIPKVLFDSERLIQYTSPSILLNAIILISIFSRLDIKKTTIIKELSPLSFGVYLLQNNQIIWDEILLDRFSFITNFNILYGLLLVLLCAFVIFWAGILVDKFRKELFKLLRIDKSSILIASLINHVFNKLDNV